MFDVIIATYNRFEKATCLASDLLRHGEKYISSIYIVDSTEYQKVQKTGSSKIVHLLSTHKNQPFQRYLGYLQTTSTFVLFLDDDMEIIDEKFMDILNGHFLNHYSALAIHFKDKHDNTSLNMIPKSKIMGGTSMFRVFFNWFTAYPILPEGVFGHCGVKGPQPKDGGETHFVSGGAFAARRECLYKNFNFELFNLYEQKLGKGEDAMIGYTLSKQGKIFYIPTLLFYHNDQQDSAYSIDQFAFARRVTFSRLYLSLERSRLNSENLLISKLIFHWHSFWRIAGLGLNYILNRSTKRKQLLLGALAGWKDALFYHFEFVENNQLSFSYE